MERTPKDGPHFEKHQFMSHCVRHNIFYILWLLSFAAVCATVGIVDFELKYNTITGKYFWFFRTQTFFAGITLLYVLLKKVKISFSSLDLFMCTFIIYCTVNYLVRDTDFEIKVLLLLFLGTFYICLRIFIQSISSVRRLLPVILIAIGCRESIYGLLQLYGFSQSYHELYKITGHFFNPGPFSGFVAFTVPLAVYYTTFCWKDAQIRLRVISALLIQKKLTWLDKIKSTIWSRGNISLLVVGLSLLNLTTALLVIPAAMSRSAWLAIIAGVAVVLVVRHKLSNKAISFFHRNKKQSVLMLIGAIGIAIVFFAGIYNLKRESADGRLFLWQISVRALSKVPVFGAGLGNFAGVYGEEQYRYFSQGIDQETIMKAGSPVYAFNEFIQIGVEQGLIGLALFLCVVIIAIRSCIKDKGKIGVLGAIVAILVFSFTSYPFSILPICIFFIALIALANNDQKKSKTRKIFLVIFLITIFVFNLRFLHTTTSLKNAYAAWGRLSLINVSKGINEHICGNYADIENWLLRYPGYLYSYGNALSKIENYRQSNELLHKGLSISCDPKFCILIGSNYQMMGQFDKAEAYYIRAYYTLPNRLYPLYLLTKLYHETGQEDKARTMAKKLLAQKPKVMSTAVKEMKDYAHNLLINKN